MIIDQKVVVAAPIVEVWDLLMDVPAVSRCVPGVESIEEIDADTYKGVVKVRVGPVGVRLSGNVVITEREAGARRASVRMEAADERIRGSVNAKSTMELRAIDDHSTEMLVHTDAAVMGKLGEFGQAVIRRKADQIVAEFVRNLAEQVARGPSHPADHVPAK